MSDLDCRCTGMLVRPDRCENPASEEDGLCDLCRSNGCESKRAEVLAAIRERFGETILMRLGGE